MEKDFSDIPENLRNAWVGWEIGLAKGKTPEEVVHLSVLLGFIEARQEEMFVMYLKTAIQTRGYISALTESEADDILLGRPFSD